MISAADVHGASQACCRDGSDNAGLAGDAGSVGTTCRGPAGVRLASLLFTSPPVWVCITLPFLIHPGFPDAGADAGRLRAGRPCTMLSVNVPASAGDVWKCRGLGKTNASSITLSLLNLK